MEQKQEQPLKQQVDWFTTNIINTYIKQQRFTLIKIPQNDSQKEASERARKKFQSDQLLSASKIHVVV